MINFFPHDHKAHHVKALDGLRGVAVLIVLLSHSSNFGMLFHPYLNFRYSGKVGVYLFFVLSAYLLDYQIAQAFIKGKANQRYWSNYFLRRFLRIFPLFALALVVHYLFTLAGITTVIDVIEDIPKHLFLLAGENIFWSIPVEFKYYFISPLIMWACHKLGWNTPKIVLLLVSLISLSIVFNYIFHLPDISMFKYLPLFLVGTLVAILSINHKEQLQVYGSYFDKISILLGVVIVITMPFYMNRLFNLNPNFQTSAFFTAYGLAWGVILLAALYGQGIIKWIFEWKPLRFLGTISFSLYLFHFPVLRTLKVLGLSSFVNAFVFFAVSIFIASISYLLIEQPLSKIRIR